MCWGVISISCCAGKNIRAFINSKLKKNRCNSVEEIGSYGNGLQICYELNDLTEKLTFWVIKSGLS